MTQPEYKLIDGDKAKLHDGTHGWDIANCIVVVVRKDPVSEGAKQLFALSDEALARRIVTAVNCHEVLVDIADEVAVNHTITHEMQVRAHAALALAEENDANPS